MIPNDAIISVIAPLSDQKGALETQVIELLDTLRPCYKNFEVILVDHGVCAETGQLARKLVDRHEGLRYIGLSRRLNREIAIAAGLETSIGDVVSVLTLGIDPPDEIPTLADLAHNSHGVALGVSQRPSGRGRLFRTGRSMFYWTLQRLTGFHLPEGATGFCAVARPVVNALTRIHSRKRHLRLSLGSVGFPIHHHSYRPRKRFIDDRSLIQAISDGLSMCVMHSRTPLRLASVIGITASVLNLAYVGYVVGVYLIKADVQAGWVTLSLQNAGMFFFVFVSLLLMSEYLTQTLDEVQERPLYHVRDEAAACLTTVKAERNVLIEPGTSMNEKQDIRRAA